MSTSTPTRHQGRIRALNGITGATTIDAKIINNACDTDEHAEQTREALAVLQTLIDSSILTGADKALVKLQPFVGDWLTVADLIAILEMPGVIQWTEPSLMKEIYSGYNEEMYIRLVHLGQVLYNNLP